MAGLARESVAGEGAPADSRWAMISAALWPVKGDLPMSSSLEHGPECVAVGPGIQALPARLFRGQVRGGAQELDL